MNEVLQNILTRSSVKRYKPDMVESDKIDQIVQAGLYAPSGMNHQSAKIIVVKNKQVRDELAKINSQIGGWGEDFDPFYGAPVVLIVVADKDWFTGVYDGSLVMGNMMLAAHSLGVGSCWIHRAKEEFEMPKYREFLKSLGIDGNYEGIGHCVLGYHDGELPQPKPRKENRVYYVD